MGVVQQKQFGTVVFHFLMGLLFSAISIASEAC